ncbi:ABC transporter transmembrane domain-containing protein [Zooshikella harenae]|uniref:ATP-binding cassette domain-containing protein n=1 Tax=Zooshikella harenae TaxID=2827238 RepID=A0ABS5ZAZ1_9GAMM|nr:ABC transporter transmembrane domain-containing protein [Zooshikella harenae]MBU2711164.1 ATP-binding cassette domain-containing protein [Zooshikella harenae]
MHLFWKLRWFFQLERKRYLSAVTALLIISGLVMIPPKLAGYIVDQINQQHLNADQLLQYCGGLALLALFIYGLRVLWRIWLFGASHHLGAILRQQLFNRLVSCNSAFYQQHPSGDLLARATQDVDAVVMTAGEGVLAMIDGLLTGIIVLFIMSFFISWPLTLVALLPWPVMGFFMYRISQQLFSAFHTSQTAFSELNDCVQEQLSGIRLVKACGQEHYAQHLFQQQAVKATDASFAVAKVDSQYDPVITLTVASSFLLSVAFGGWLVANNRITLGELTSFTMYLGFLIWPMFAFGWLLNIMERGAAAYERVQSLIDEAIPLPEGKASFSAQTISINLELHHFHYPAYSTCVLHALKIQVSSGQTLGILGPTGCGKSTVLKLLMGLYPCSNLQLFFNEHSYRVCTAHSWRKHIAYVPQDPFLFSMSIAENIALGKPDASIEEIQQAAQIADIHEDITLFPQGYNTQVGERGVTLSGGQRQRLAIARALLLDAPLLILDDALSAVDVKTEQAILSNLKHVRQNCTTIIAGHRISATTDADQIIVLQQGKLIEQGKHNELLNHNGWYAQAYHYQQLEQRINAR